MVPIGGGGGPQRGVIHQLLRERERERERERDGTGIIKKCQRPVLPPQIPAGCPALGQALPRSAALTHFRGQAKTGSLAIYSFFSVDSFFT